MQYSVSDIILLKADVEEDKENHHDSYEYDESGNNSGDIYALSDWNLRKFLSFYLSLERSVKAKLFYFI